MRFAGFAEYAVSKKEGRPDAVWITLFLVVMGLGVALRLANHNVSNPTPDEKTYAYYADQVAHGSIDTPGRLTENYNAHPDQWIYPTPIRTGYYYLLAAAMKCSGASACEAGVAVSSLSSIVQFILVAIIGLRFFDRWTTLIALALFSVCPMDLAIARRVWQDGVVGCAGLMLFYSSMEASLRPRKKVWLALFWMCGFFFLLLKESSGLIFGFYCAWLTGMCLLRKCPPMQCAGIAMGCVVTGLLAFVTMALLSGGVSSVIAVYQHATRTMPFNAYAVNFQNGPWYSCPLCWWILSPVAASLCCLGAAGWIFPGQPLRRTLQAALLLDEKGCAVAGSMAACIFFVTAITFLPFYLKNLRYVSPVYGTEYLLGALGLRWLLEMCRASLSPAFLRMAITGAVMLIAGAVAADFVTFDRLFLKAGLDDLAAGRLIEQAFPRPLAPGQTGKS